jgi:hypothetical protein
MWSPAGIRRADLLAAARIAAATLAFAALAALTVHLASAAQARQVLGFTFPGIPRRLSQSEAIFLNNARMLAGILVGAGVVQLLAVDQSRGLDHALGIGVRTICDVALAIATLVNALIVGSSLGAYGSRALSSMLPHGPFELGAFSLALSLYLSARRSEVTRRRFVVTGVVAMAALAIGAMLEVYGR